MSTRLEHHPNDVWVAAMSGEGARNPALLEELSQFLRRLLASTLDKRNLDDDTVDDLAQEAMFQLVKSLHTFRGDSAFPTWAASVATRVAFTELRRRAAHEAKHAAFRQAESDALESGQLDEDSLDGTVRDRLLAALDAAIESELTDRQRVATLALLRGVPTIEIAEQLESNQNAVYKLVHDARLRLRHALQRQATTSELLEEFLEGGMEQ